jgi:hypothetical protein
MAGYLYWAIEAADRLDQLEQQRNDIIGGLETYSETNRILKQWAELVNNLGTLRNRDGLRLEVTPFVEWRFCSHSSGAYLDGTVHALAFRDDVSHRVSLRVREDVRIHDGKVSRFIDDEGVTRKAGIYITDTTLPDKARDIVNVAIRDAWQLMGEELPSILRECVAYQVVKEIRNDKTYLARRIVAEYGEVK